MFSLFGRALVSLVKAVYRPVSIFSRQVSCLDRPFYHAELQCIEFCTAILDSRLTAKRPVLIHSENMLRVIRIAFAVAIVVAVVAILIHPYIDGPNSVARRHHLRSVVLVAFFFAANKLIPNYNSLAAPASPVVQNADRDLLAQTCTRLC